MENTKTKEQELEEVREEARQLLENSSSFLLVAGDMTHEAEGVRLDSKVMSSGSTLVIAGFILRLGDVLKGHEKLQQAIATLLEAEAVVELAATEPSDTVH